MNILEVKNLRKRFLNGDVLKNISFNINEGEVLTIIGPSGAGKSTLLRCITQLERIDHGEIKICGDTLATTNKENKVIYANKEMQAKIGLKVGLVFQQFNLFPHFSVLRNITEPQVKILKKSKEESIAIAMKLLDKMNLKYKANSYPCDLSGGQKQRVAIARALAMEPKILFFDEPTSALDPKLKGEFVSIVKELSYDNMTLIIITHEMQVAKRVSNKIAFMDHGKIVEMGLAKDIIHNPKYLKMKMFIDGIV